MVKRENVNCVAVEWKKGVKTQYAQAANNVRVVAAQVAAMITFLMVSHGRSDTSRTDTVGGNRSYSNPNPKAFGCD